MFVSRGNSDGQMEISWGPEYHGGRCPVPYFLVFHLTLWDSVTDYFAKGRDRWFAIQGVDNRRICCCLIVYLGLTHFGRWIRFTVWSNYPIWISRSGMPIKTDGKFAGSDGNNSGKEHGNLERCCSHSTIGAEKKRTVCCLSTTLRSVLLPSLAGRHNLKRPIPSGKSSFHPSV